MFSTDWFKYFRPRVIYKTERLTISERFYVNLGIASTRKKVQLRKLNKSIRRKNRLIVRLRRELDYRQAMLDGYMMEFAPEDMTEKQIKEWGRRQVRSKFQMKINSNEQA